MSQSHSQSVIETLTDRLRIGSCRFAHETQDDAAIRRIKTDLEAADRIENLEGALRDALCEMSALALQVGVRPGGSVNRAQIRARAALNLQATS
jgi:hypothetical protein